MTRLAAREGSVGREVDKKQGNRENKNVYLRLSKKCIYRNKRNSVKNM